MSYRPTVLALADESCNRAVDFYEQGAPHDREIFQVGTACHHVMQAAGEETNRRGEILEWDDCVAIARQVRVKLTSTGRTFDGEPEPPMKPNQAKAGADIALEFLAMSPLRPGGLYEPGIAVDRDWKPVPYDSPKRWIRTALDSVRIEEDENGERVLEVTDTKTSWATDADRLNHVQQIMQALLALAHYGDGVDRLTRRVINMRKWSLYVEDHYVAFPEFEETVAEWRAYVEDAIAALEVKPRIATPGAHCLGCRYQGQCEDSREWLETVSPQASPEDMATGYAVAIAEAARLKSLLVEACGEVPVELADGIVGFQRQSATRLTDGAYGALLEEWSAGDGSLEKTIEERLRASSSIHKGDIEGGLADGLITALADDAKRSVDSSMRGLLHALDLSKTSAEKALRVLYPDRADIDHRKEWLAAHTEPFGKKRFLVTKK